MQVNLVTTMFVLESQKNSNKRKNDIKKIKLLVRNDNTLPKVVFKKDHMTSLVKENLKSIINSDNFYLEQVFTHNYNDDINVIYLGITNEENIIELNNNYELVDFDLKNNHILFLGKKHYFYVTKEIEDNNNMVNSYEVSAFTDELKNMLLEILISYKKIREKIDDTEIVFKFLSNTFTLEDIRLVYELIKDKKTDKSNFRKRIIKYCKKVNEEKENNAYRPSQKYKYKPIKSDPLV